MTPTIIPVVLGVSLLLALAGYALSQDVLLPGHGRNAVMLWFTVIMMALALLMALVAIIMGVNAR